MVRRGFTIVELLIIIVVMGILLVIGVVNLRGTQANARDKQREANVQVIASNLEQFYSEGTGTGTIGRYPSTAAINSSSTPTAIKGYLKNLDEKVLIEPGDNSGTVNSIRQATTATQTVAGINPKPATNSLIYVYQPLYLNSSNAWTLCTSESQACRKFNIYYLKETDTANPIQMITSRNQ